MLIAVAPVCLAQTRAAQLPLSGASQPAGTVNVNGELSSNGSNTINNSIQIQGPYSGSVLSGEATAEPLKIALSVAVERGIQFNLGSILYGNATQLAHGQARAARSALLPNLTAGVSPTAQQLSLDQFGFRLSGVPTVVGPFNYFTAGVTLNQTVADVTAWRNYRAARENVEAARFSTLDARDVVAMAVGGAYLEVIAYAARVTSAQAQVALAEAVYQQALDRHSAGLNAQIDVTRTRVELQTQQQRLTTAENDLAKSKISLARLIGLPAAQPLELTDNPPYSPLDSYGLDNAISDARRCRSDLKASAAQLRAAKEARGGAAAERLPSVAMTTTYGATGRNPAHANGTFIATASLRIPIFEGGRIAAEVVQADAALAQRNAEYSELSARIDAEIRVAFLDLRASASQVAVAESSVALARDTLRQARDRFAAGVADTIEVVQAQESLASAEADYISSLFSNNLAKISLARATGQTLEKTRQFLNIP